MTCIIVKIRQDGDNDEPAGEADSKQTTPENMEVDSKKTVTPESVKADSKQANASEKAEVDSIPTEQPEPADSSQNEKDDKNNEAVPSEKR